MDIKKANTNFSIEQLLIGDLAKQKFKIDFMPMWQMLDNWERKLPNGFKDVEMKDIFERIYEYAVVSVGLDKNDMVVRIDNLNEQNLKWCTRALSAEKEIETLKGKISELQS